MSPETDMEAFVNDFEDNRSTIDMANSGIAGWSAANSDIANSDIANSDIGIHRHAIAIGI